MFYFLLNAETNEIIQIPCLQEINNSETLVVLQRMSLITNSDYIQHNSVVRIARGNTIDLIEKYYGYKYKVELEETHHLTFNGGTVLCDLYMIYRSHVKILRQLHPDVIKEFISLILRFTAEQDLAKPYAIYYRHVNLEKHGITTP